jgi:hypothetical protein
MFLVGGGSRRTAWTPGISNNGAGLLAADPPEKVNVQ